MQYSERGRGYGRRERGVEVNHLCRIVPVEHGADAKFCRTMGTRVLLPSGEALPHVSKITLVASVNDIWRATIECTVAVDPVIVAASIDSVAPRQVNLPARLTWWRRLMLRWAGVDAVDVTSLDSEEMEWVKP